MGVAPLFALKLKLSGEIRIEAASRTMEFPLKLPVSGSIFVRCFWYDGPPRAVFVSQNRGTVVIRCMLAR
ncbi:hypothetical protein NDN08_006068 [Rhodosorus marinus]|uniref:Uncharacterized protein n=1 Tax=Rhodosorus marinus TaxID=101924 RepID=A0AAV8UJM9_9RHOD|nr:hypothetical protein NDN08_006068 [Rhodosorus marinus]